MVGSRDGWDIMEDLWKIQSIIGPQPGRLLHQEVQFARAPGQVSDAVDFPYCMLEAGSLECGETGSCDYRNCLDGADTVSYIILY